MARTPSSMLELGTKLPTFSLTNGVDNTLFTSDDLTKANGLLVMFICNHCPFVIHVKEQLQDLAKWAESNQVGVVAINANDVANYPADSPQKMLLEGYEFPYLYDKSQEVAKQFQASCTPDFYLFNGKKALYYRGQLDDARPGNDEAIDGHSLRKAISAMANGDEADSVVQFPSIGCNIKWQAGNEPHYYR
jgi:thiol-disulfide isomerase/thioredoxin